MSLGIGSESVSVYRHEILSLQNTRVAARVHCITNFTPILEDHIVSNGESISIGGTRDCDVPTGRQPHIEAFLERALVWQRSFAMMPSPRLSCKMSS